MLSCCVAPETAAEEVEGMEESALRGDPGGICDLGDLSFDLKQLLRSDPALAYLPDEVLEAMVDAEFEDGVEMPEFPVFEEMGEPFPNQQAIPKVPTVPEDAPVVKAVLVGPTYKTSKHRVPMMPQLSVLLGSIGALEDIMVALQHAKVKTPELRVLTDATTKDGWPVPHEPPTRKNILNSMQWLVKDARPGENLLFFFAGHGGQSRDKDGDEEDGQDEHLCPIIQGQHPNFGAALEGSLEQEEADDLLGRAITDDEIFEKMLKDLPEGVRLTTIFDACHSGTMADLPHTYSVQVEDDEMARARRQEPPPPGFSFDKRPLIHKELKGRPTAASVLCLAGCKDRETQQTWCDQSGPGMRGAYFLTNMLAKAIAGMRTKDPSYADVLRELTRDFYRGNRLQMSVPSFSTSRAVDLDAKPFSLVGLL